MTKDSRRSTRRARGPGESALLLLDAIEILNRHGVRYAVVGAMAAAVYGAVRATTYADALLGIAVSRLEGLHRVFFEAGFSSELRRGGNDDPLGGMLILTDESGNCVELIAGIRGMDPAAFERRREVPFEGVSLHVVGLEDFIAMKCFAGGPLDLADARQALNAADSPVRIDLVRRLARRFGRPAADALERLLDES